MLPQVILDDERFTDIMEQAKKRIADIFPMWTDYNYHDPGITLLELFAWMKEMQQFHMDRIGEESVREYLRLVGVEPYRKRASRAVVRLDGFPGTQFFPEGSRFYAGNVCFEADGPIRVGAAEAVRLSVCTPGGGSGPAYRLQTGERTDMEFPVFGMRPAMGSALRIGISEPLKPHTVYRFGIRIAQREETRINPIPADSDFYPLAEISLRFSAACGERRGEIVEDTTHCFLEDGFIGFCLDGETVRDGEGLCWITLVLERCGYGAPPMLAGISLREAGVRQQRTVAECCDGHLETGGVIRLSGYLAFTGSYLLFRREGGLFFPYEGRVERRIGDEEAVFSLPELSEKGGMDYRIVLYEEELQERLRIGEGTGLPYQEYDVRIPGLCGEGLLLMTETGEGSGCYICPEQRGDFLQAGPSDAVFVFGEESGTVRFGDCEQGLAPEGKILLVAGRQSLGQEGNVKEGSISRFGGAEQGSAGQGVTPAKGEAGRPAVTNTRPAAGGRAAETPEECTRRMASEPKELRHAVTYEDYERMAMRTPGLAIESVRAIPAVRTQERDKALQEECVTLVVKPRSPEREPALSEAYRENILRALEPGRLIGTRIAVVSPEYIGISLFAEITTGMQEETARVRIREALDGYFADIAGSFGAAVRVSAIYGTLDVLGEVNRIGALSLDAKGKDIRRSRNGDLILPPNGLAYLRECMLSISSDR